jgi:2-oxoglutarate ferredoxin oxidoreductase subunit alpha
MEGSTTVAGSHPPRHEVEDVVIRFAGDSGDGVQITGGQFTQTTALAGNELATFPDFPAEIRAPAGTTRPIRSATIRWASTRSSTSTSRR